MFSRNVALASIMVLALGDSLSHLGRFGSIRHPFNKTRFLEGTAIGIVAGTLGALYFVPFSAAFFGSLAAMIAESFDLRVSKVKIDDNLLIPLVAGLVMSLVVLNISYAPAFSHPSSFQTIPTTEETEKIALSDTEKFNINECIERRIMPKETNKITTRALLNIFGNRTPSDCPKEILSSFPTQDKIDACTYSKGIVGDEEIVLWIAREYIFLERNRSGNKTFYQPTYQTIEVNRSMGISHADIEMYPWGEISPFCLAEEEHPYLRLSENYSEDYSLSLEKIGDDIYAKIGIDHMIGVEGCLMSGQGYFGLTTSESKFNLSARLVPPFSINACNLMEQQDRDKCTCVFALYQEGGTWIDYLPDSLNMVGNINDVDLRNECEEEVRKTWEAMENRDEIIRPEKFQAMEKEIKPKLEDTYIRNVLCGEFCKDGTCLGNPPAGRGVCTVPEEEMLIGYETEICKGTYNLTAGIKVAVDGTDIDCKGATLVGNGTGIGIDVNAYRNVTIRNCNISNFDIGISTAGSNTLLENNSIENSKNGGISANGANSISIFNNTLSQNSGTSIKLSKVVTGKITNNTVSTTFYDESGFGGIFIENSNGIILQHNEIINNDIGTQITDSEGVLIYENIFENNGIGLTMDALYSEVSNNSIRKNKFRYNRDIGMYLFRASENSFLENEFYGTGIEEQIINETMYTNIFCSVNITNYYYDGAYGPSCGPKIEILFPKEGVNEGDFEDVVVITDRIAECKYSMTKEYPDGNLKSLGGKLGSEDGIRHTIVIILSPKGHKDRVEVTCVDSSGNDSKNSVTFSSR
ncbi:MAG: right-handed parallel beta-helix repeat-containing protein [Candidatus Aenigmarchaeota archaeon]|nr:right-handed parallel beta-helix repeat-containing protein [Candidatus Aenigmarchaeota archaeon]